MPAGQGVVYEYGVFVSEIVRDLKFSILLLQLAAEDFFIDRFQEARSPKFGEPPWPHQ